MKEWMASIQSYSNVLYENDKLRKIDDIIMEKARIKNELELATPEDENTISRVHEDFEPIVNPHESYSDFDYMFNISPSSLSESQDFDGDAFKRMQRFSVIGGGVITNVQ
jgi:hypothetical protein